MTCFREPAPTGKMEMKESKFRSMLDSLATLTPHQREELASALSQMAASSTTFQPIHRRQPSECPHCSSDLFVRKGRADGLQRYLCQNCSRTFNATTGTLLSGLRDKEQFEAFVDSVREGLSVRAAASKTGVPLNTAVRWHRKLLQRSDSASQAVKP